jgi:hypothetical protein
MTNTITTVYKQWAARWAPESLCDKHTKTIFTARNQLFTTIYISQNRSRQRSESRRQAPRKRNRNRDKISTDTLEKQETETTTND